MKLRCPECGQTERFLGSQSCRGTVSVEVDGKGNFSSNLTECGHAPTEDLDWDDPEGPFICTECPGEVKAIEEE